MRSMTGCGTGRAQKDGWEVTAELKAVNHRYLDISMRLPRNISFLEKIVRTETGKELKRGHIDVYITVRNVLDSSVEIHVDQDLARQYSEISRTLCETVNAVNDLSVTRLMTMEGVITLTEREMDQELIAALCSEAVQSAVKQVSVMREKEGNNLKEDLQNHLDATALLRKKIVERAPMVVAEYRDKLDTRLKKMLNDSIDPQRLAQEVALMADRCAIDEELARLESHINQMRQYLVSEGEIGKKMDFLIQEMNREANTIGSKAQDGQVAQLVVDLKSEIEKLREQIQNVE